MSWYQFIERFRRKRWAYLRTFTGPDGKPHPEAAIVLKDLKRFCGINRGGIVVSPVGRVVDPYASIYRAGLRDVYLRIAKHLGLDESDLEEESHVENETSHTGP